jgi:hypothetical protein
MRTTKHRINIKPLELSPDQVKGLLTAKGPVPMTIDLFVDHVSSGRVHEIEFSFMAEEQKFINDVIAGGLVKREGKRDDELMATLARRQVEDAELITELERQRSILISYIDHEDICESKNTGVADDNCSICTDGDLHDILFPPGPVDKELLEIRAFDNGDGKRGDDRRLNMAWILKTVRGAPFALHKEEIISRLDFPISEASVKRHLAILLGEDLITKTGENRDTRYWK